MCSTFARLTITLILLVLAQQQLLAGLAGKKPLAELEKDTIYVVVPNYWEDTLIKSTFRAELFRRLDTSATVVNRSVHRIGIAGMSLPALPFDPSYFPDVEQLYIYAVESIPAEVKKLTKLRSLEVRSFHYYYDDDRPGPYPDYFVSDVIMALPHLEEISLESPVYIAEEVGDHPSLRVLDVEMITLPAFFLRRNNTITFSELNHQAPYSEIAALAQTSYRRRRCCWECQDMTFMTDTFPYWFPGNSEVKKPRMHAPTSNGKYSAAYPNGKLIVSGAMRHGKPDGEWKFWYANGQLSETRKYANGKEAGRWVFFSESGDTIRIFDFENSGELAAIRYLWYREWQDDHSLQGMAEYYPGPNSRCETRYYHEWNGIDTIHSAVKYCMQNGISQLPVGWSWSRGRLRSRGEYINSVWVTTEFDSLGRVSAKHADIAGGVIDSLFYPDGSRTVRMVIRDSVFTTDWNSAGIKVSGGAFIRHDTISGVIHFYFTNGKIQRISHYSWGKLDGTTQIFDQSGNLIEERFYRKGMLEEPEE